MQVTKKDRQSKMYRKYNRLFKDGYYIQHAFYKGNINVYCLVKDRQNKIKDISYYLAYNVALMLKKEFGFVIRKDKNISVALNFNPNTYTLPKNHIAGTYV